MTPQYILTLLWIGVASVGLLVNIYALSDARIDLTTVQRWSHEGTKALVAKGNLRREKVRATIQSIFLVVGVTALFVPPCESVKGLRSLIAIGLMSVAAMTVYNSLQDRRDRQILLEMIRRQDEAEHNRRNEEMKRRAQTYLTEELRKKGETKDGE